MRFFSSELKKLFSGLQVKSMKRVQMVPKSRSGMPPGSLIFFNYRFGGWTAVLSVSPVTKDAKRVTDYLLGSRCLWTVITPQIL
jgi:hypothetical protein